MPRSIVYQQKVNERNLRYYEDKVVKDLRDFKRLGRNYMTLEALKDDMAMLHDFIVRWQHLEMMSNGEEIPWTEEDGIITARNV